MGTDIHLFVERRVESGEWIPVLGHRGWEQANHRDYWLFGVLAGVRGQGPAISPPKGLPVDVSRSVRETGVEHTPSWLTVAELQSFDWASECKRAGREGYENFTSFISEIARLGRPEDVRIVFWFDS